MADISSSLSLPFIQPSQAQKHVTHNEAIRILDVVAQLGVIADDQTTPPASPTEGARYIVDTGSTGAWASRDAEVAVFEDGNWRFFVPRAGWRAYVINRETLMVFDGSEWIDLDSAELEEIDTFGLGMVSLPGSAFCAKLNAALWTALYQADGGSGDVLTSLNKEASTNDTGFVFQTDFQTRGLFGLFGDNNLRLATSADGTNFNDGLIVDGATGVVAQPQLPRFQGVSNFDNYAVVDTWVKIGINQMSYNAQNTFDAGTNVFTAPVTGTYQFGGLLTFKQDSSTAARMGGQLVLNGTSPIAGSRVENTSTHQTGRTSLAIQTLVPLSQGDTVELQGIMRNHPGYFMADRCDFWGLKIG